MIDMMMMMMMMMIEVSKKSRALNETQSHSYGISVTVWYIVLPSTRHKWTRPSLTTARGRYSIYLS